LWLFDIWSPIVGKKSEINDFWFKNNDFCLICRFLWRRINIIGYDIYPPLQKSDTGGRVIGRAPGRSMTADFAALLAKLRSLVAQAKHEAIEQTWAAKFHRSRLIFKLMFVSNGRHFWSAFSSWQTLWQTL